MEIFLSFTLQQGAFDMVRKGILVQLQQLVININKESIVLGMGDFKLFGTLLAQLLSRRAVLGSKCPWLSTNFQKGDRDEILKRNMRIDLAVNTWLRTKGGRIQPQSSSCLELLITLKYPPIILQCRMYPLLSPLWQTSSESANTLTNTSQIN